MCSAEAAIKIKQNKQKNGEGDIYSMNTATRE